MDPGFLSIQKCTLGRLEGRKARRGFYSLHIGIDAIV